MTVPELIARILHTLEAQFYCDLPRRDFKRDEQYLVAAIGTYGWECVQRGWEFDTQFIYSELCRLLTSFKHAGTEITWMPNYLQHAIRQHIREHAESLQRQARATVTPRAVTKIMDGLALSKIIVEPTSTQLAASIYHDVKKLRKKALADRRYKTQEERRQKDLL